MSQSTVNEAGNDGCSITVALPKSVGRVVCWFSCGDTSAVATALALKKYRGTREIIVARIHIPSEHPDNERFAADCERWFGQPIIELRSNQYTDTWDVWERRRYIAGIQGAPCTAELKRAVRYAYQHPSDHHIFGYAIDGTDPKRAIRLAENNFEISMEFPLMEARLRKADCHSIIRAAGIDLPAMYLLGFDNNNCIGCPKGGAGYWNMIRKHFPAQFDRMAKLSRELGARLVKQDGARIFLDELRETTGRQKDELVIDCSAFCDSAVEELELTPQAQSPSLGVPVRG